MTTLIRDQQRAVPVAGLQYYFPGLFDANVSIANNNNGLGIDVTVTVTDQDGGRYSPITVPAYQSQYFSLACPRVLDIQGAGANISIIGTTADEEVRIEPITTLVTNPNIIFTKAVSFKNRRQPRRIILFDDFEAATLKWNTSAGTISRDTTALKVIEGAADMLGVTGVVAGNQWQAVRRVGFSSFTKVVVELWWAAQTAAPNTLRDFFLIIVLDDGGTQKFMGVRYLHFNATVAQRKWQYSLTTTPTWNDITGGAELLAPFDSGSPYAAHYLRMHVDFGAVDPVLTELHTDKLDLLLNITGPTHFAGGTPRMDVNVGGTTDIAAGVNGSVDDILVSDQEV